MRRMRIATQSSLGNLTGQQDTFRNLCFAENAGAALLQKGRCAAQRDRAGAAKREALSFEAKLFDPAYCCGSSRIAVNAQKRCQKSPRAITGVSRMS
jgi:hypothetical protein